MTLEEAIELLEHDYQAHHDVQNPIPAIAIRLGIEALRALIHGRANPLLPAAPKLPGETQD